MDIKHQLVLWKKAGYLLDHLSLTQDIVDRLVDADVLTADMVASIHSKTYSTERTLQLLCYLGEHGRDVFNKFVDILDECKHWPVVKELRKTEKFTHFGEMLPPSFTYFLDISEFLRKYPHIAIKLGEDEKHLVHIFIEGKIEMEARKRHESNHKLEEQVLALQMLIQDLRAVIKGHEESEQRLENSLHNANERINQLNIRIQELEILNTEYKSEVRSLKHFRHEQEEMDKYLSERSQELGMSEIGVPPSMQLGRMPSLIDCDKKKSDSMRLRLLASQVHLSVNKLYYVQSHLQQLETLEKRLTGLTDKPNIDSANSLQMKQLLVNAKQERKALSTQFCEEELDIYSKQKEIEALRKEIFGSPHTPFGGGSTGGEHASLQTKTDELMATLTRLHHERMRDRDAKHEKSIADMVKHIQEMTHQHQDELDKVKFRMKAKMMELHRREILHRRMKAQINVITRYHAKNMNATQSLDDCRKIVRGVIGDTRRLKKMIDVAEEMEKNPLNAKQLDQLEKLQQQQQQQQQHQEVEEKKEKTKKKKKKKRKKPDYLNNERLMFIADRMQDQWRDLGIKIGLSHNRMDMMEIEAPGGGMLHTNGPDSLLFAILKSWRDDENGKVDTLMDALDSMDRHDLALIVMPPNRVQIVRQKTQVSEPDPDILEDDLDFLDPSLDLNDEANFMKTVPKLPPIAV